MGFEAGFGGKTVTGAPFSATFSTQTTQALADGNQIQRSTTGTIARDSQGRTRRDMTLPAIGAWGTSGQAAPHAVFINDSVAGTQYILQPDQKDRAQGAWTQPRQAPPWRTRSPQGDVPPSVPDRAEAERTGRDDHFAWDADDQWRAGGGHALHAHDSRGRDRQRRIPS